jgi:RNA polymerase sigma-70 factor (ECF subfamily)
MDHTLDVAVSHCDVRTALARLLPELRGFARYLAGDRAEADDLVQEAVLRTLRALEAAGVDGATTPAITGLRPWCLGVIRNVYHEQLRARRRAARHAGSVVGISPPPPQEGRGDIRDLAHGLAALPPLLREALLLIGAQGLSLEAAAAVCRVPVGTMKARVSRARRQLAAVLDRPAR